MKHGCTTCPSLAAFLAGACLVGSLSATGDALTEYRAAKQKALAPVQAEYERVVTAHKSDPAIREYRERLELVDEVTAQILKTLDAIIAASAASIADAVPGDPARAEPLATDAQGRPASNALRILAECRGTFEEELPVLALAEGDQTAMRRYASLSMSAAAVSVAEHGRTAHATATSDEVARQALCLAAVLPLLNTRDEMWTKAMTESLPEWTRQPGSLTILEDLALHAQRPFTAFQLSRHARNESDTTTAAGESGYLQAAGRGMRESRDYPAAMQCFRAGASLARDAGREPEVVACLCQLAETLGAAGDHAAAADQMKVVVAEHPDSEGYGRLVVLRAKYLFRAGNLGTLWVEAQAAREDGRCQKVLPELLYISWLTARRLNRQDAATAIKDEFLKRFPEHPWCGDMYLHSALVACLSGNDDETRRLFDLIKERFPESRASESARLLGERLHALGRARKQDLMQNWQNPPSL